jgi:hypothetical protein
MRTTLSLDDDILEAAKAIARQSRKSIGEVVSELVRSSLRRPAPQAERNGIPLLAPSDKAAIVTLDIVNALRDELP